MQTKPPSPVRPISEATIEQRRAIALIAHHWMTQKRGPSWRHITRQVKSTERPVDFIHSLRPYGVRWEQNVEGSLRLRRDVWRVVRQAIRQAHQKKAS